MKIKVDSRVGSKHLVEPLIKLCKLQGNKHTVEQTTLPYGDFAFTAMGPDDSPLPIGIELCKVPDLLQKLKSERFTAHQLPGLLDSYQVVYLVIEGRYKAHADDSLAVYAPSQRRYGWGKTDWQPSGFRYSSVANFLNSLAAFPRVIVVKTWDETETTNWLKCTADWWSKPWEEHSGFSSWAGQDVLGNPLTFRKPSLVEQFVALLPGIGKDKARIVADKFGSIRRVVNARVEDWVGIRPPGKTATGRAKQSITLASAEEIQRALDKKHE